MLIKKPSDIAGSEITPKSIYQRRRDFMKGAGLLVGGSLLPGVSAAQSGDALKARAPAGLKTSPAAPWLQNKFTSIAPAPDVAPFYTDEALTPYDDVTRYNNLY
jgi:sulfoxide reductase catalytic subunit YedY